MRLRSWKSTIISGDGSNIHKGEQGEVGLIFVFRFSFFGFSIFVFRFSFFAFRFSIFELSRKMAKYYFDGKSYFDIQNPAKAQASLRIRAVSPEPSLFAGIKYGNRRRVRQKIRHLDEGSDKKSDI